MRRPRRRWGAESEDERPLRSSFSVKNASNSQPKGLRRTFSSQDISQYTSNLVSTFDTLNSIKFIYSFERYEVCLIPDMIELLQGVNLFWLIISIRLYKWSAILPYCMDCPQFFFLWQTVLQVHCGVGKSN